MPLTVDRDWVEQRLDKLYPTHNVSFAKLLIELRKLFDGDLDQMLILAVLAGGAGSENSRKTLLQQPDLRPFQPTNTHSIAEISGIPRESVRRKLKLLEGKGLIEQNEDGSWRIAQNAADRVTNPGPGQAAAVFGASFVVSCSGRRHRRSNGGTVNMVRKADMDNPPTTTAPSPR